jgi:predicted CXXCH cytochrome family protein
MTTARFAFVFLVALVLAAPVRAQTSQPNPAVTESGAQGSRIAARAPGALAPLPAKPVPVSSHAPYEAGDCKICHQSADPDQPGPVLKKGPALCLECHEEFAGVLKRAHTHAPASSDCTSCHSPHNSNYRKLLLQEPRAMCTSCHDKIGKIVSSATVQHKAVTSGAQCTACHNPHGSTVEKLLVQLPFDLCLSCHNVDTMTDAKGKKLQNLKAWLDNNKNWHGPVAGKDCSSCHEPHGGDHFRLLKADYPQQFYAPYDPRSYELCFSCHQEAAFSTAQTTTLTSFRNGATNLHFLHLQQSGRGRTCRACHEVHASTQENHIREGVPYGSGGWMLKLHFKKTANGGSCEKTCHSQKTYVNKAAR